MAIISFFKKHLIFILVLLLLLVLMLVLMCPHFFRKDDNYVARAQISEGFHVFYEYNRDHMQKDKKSCPDYDKERITNCHYIKNVHAFYNQKEDACHLIITMKKENNIDPIVQGKSLLFNINFKNNILQCYTDIDENNKYLVEKYSKCQFILSKKINNTFY